MPESLDLDHARFIVKKVGPLLCGLQAEDKAVRARLAAEGQVAVWKRAVAGVRERCDVCRTSVFNLHLTCGQCGVCVCLDCYQARRRGTRYSASQASLAHPYRTRQHSALWPGANSFF